jgi:hypothetical protein
MIRHAVLVVQSASRSRYRQLRQVLLAFLPAGGVIDRLGDSREKTREKARETLVILGSLSFRASLSSVASSKSRDGKSSETPLMIFERLLKEGGLGSKVWRTREQVSFRVLLLVLFSDLSWFRRLFSPSCIFADHITSFPYAHICLSLCQLSKIWTPMLVNALGRP